MYNEPMVIIRSHKGDERGYSLDTALFRERIVTYDSAVTELTASSIIKQLLYLDSISSDDICLYINSPGGNVMDGLAILDTMTELRSDVMTICRGSACSMGCFLLTMGATGKRFITPNSFVMAHQVSAGTSGHVEDMQASFRHSVRLNERLMNSLAERVGMPYDEFIQRCNRDLWLSADEARDFGEFGFVDGILTGKRNSDNMREVLLRNNEVKFI